MSRGLGDVYKRQVTALAVVLIALLTFAPASFVELFGTFAIAVVVGYYVVWNVTHALHTPLMSVTNAISGIIIVGAVTQLGSGSWAIKVIAAITVLIASINIFGGFTVTQRMLLSLIHISEPTRHTNASRMPSSA